MRLHKVSCVFILAAFAIAGLNLYYGNRHIASSTTATTISTVDSTTTAAAKALRDNDWRLSSSEKPITSTPLKDLEGPWNDDDPDTVPPRRIPTHTACDGYDGIYHIAVSDIEGGVGTALFQLVIGQLLYAERHNLKPWVHFDDSSHVVYDSDIHGQGNGVDLFHAMVGRNATYVTRPGGHRRDMVPGPPDATTTKAVSKRDLHFKGTGIWEHYFEPVSDYVPGDASCANTLYVTMDLYLVTPGIHGFSSDYATRCWRYDYLPEYITKPHVPLAEWLEPQRTLGHAAVQKYIFVRPYLKQAAQTANPDCSVQNSCLGIHIRHSDKAAGRQVIAVAAFLPFAQAFVDAGGQHVYIATDSQEVLQQVETEWPAAVRDRVRTIGNDVIRSKDTKAVFDLASHHRTNQEVLIEILALSQCQFMVHGLSAVSESAIWINIDLHVQSVNLEDPDHLNATDFQNLVQQVLRGESHEALPRPVRTNDWWNQQVGLPPVETTASSTVGTARACDGYDGILHIGTVGNKAAAGTAFFTSVLNQILYAEMYNLKPWVHLGSDDSSKLVFDAVAHGNSSRRISLPKMVRGHAVNVTSVVGSDGQVGVYPGRPVASGGDSSSQTIELATEYAGTGVWNHYFAPLSNFDPSDESCRDKLFVSLPEHMVSTGLMLHSPTSIKAWRYDDLPAEAWKPRGVDMKDWYQPLRQRAHEIVSKFYRFQPHIVKRAGEVNPVGADEHCLAVHLRISDKSGQHRTKVKADKFEPYIDAFERAGGRTVYIATDSHRALNYIEKHFPERLTKLIRTQGRFVVRSFKEYPTHFLESHHRVNSETLVDILAMSKCDLLLHGFSTVSEAAIYLNPTLHNNSVNLEDPNRLTADDFEGLARAVLGTTNSTTGQAASNKAACVEGSNNTLSVQCVDEATILQRGDVDRKCRSNAIVYLAQKQHSSYGRDSYGILLRSFDMLHKNYLSVHGYIDNADVFIFHTGDFNATDLDVLETRFGPSYRGVIRLVDLSGSPYWRRPGHHRNDDPNSWYAYPLFSEGYRRMMHWFAIDIWEFFEQLNLKSGCSYRYLLRLDEDSFIHSRIGYDVFEMMKSNQYVYGYRMCSYEMKVAQRMWTWWGKRHPDFSPQRDLDLHMCGIYNNFFVADLEFFRSPAVQPFLRFIDKQGQIYRRRLGDLMIHSMVVYGFAPQDRVHRFLDFTYEHGTVNQTDGCLIWGGIQAGYDDPNAATTLGEYEHSMAVERQCPLNTTSLDESDLSPSYAHVPDALRGNLSLYTITAGRVELSGKGILSG